ncbi:19516_t:CDS:2 [Cetraspora pellucida]|uniref:19516_t:CDS:1 n=1 Tax=Cetraspora pellucida TaxID=1433469 RepID=A0A9N8VYH4_9GLOM|nr:19516_t:CDS:2 [Cetraspora pellucida]
MFTPSGHHLWTPPGGRWYRLKEDGTTRSSPGFSIILSLHRLFAIQGLDAST